MTSSLGPVTVPPPNVASLMSKKTDKRKTNARRKKANHGTKPNAGRG
jgi:hypothetical protein